MSEETINGIKPPRNEHELELRLVRMLGNNNRRMLVMRTMMANTIAGQFLPKGAILKGGGSLRFRFGSSFTRNTIDFDTTRRGELDGFLTEFKELLDAGWNGFTGQLVILPQASPKGVPFDYVMQPVDLKLRYKGQSWCTVNLEISHDEADATQMCDMTLPPEEVLNVFHELGFPAPEPVALITLEHQIAQKLHGASGLSEHNQRAHDLIDLQVILKSETIDLIAVREICKRLFKQRRLQPWPTLIQKRERWAEIYNAQKLDLEVLPSVDEAVKWANDLIAKIDASK